MILEINNINEYKETRQSYGCGLRKNNISLTRITFSSLDPNMNSIINLKLYSMELMSNENAFIGLKMNTDFKIIIRKR